MKLSEYAKSLNLEYLTVWKMFKRGQLPCRAEQLPSGTILVYPTEPAGTDVISRLDQLEQDMTELKRRLAPEA